MQNRYNLKRICVLLVFYAVIFSLAFPQEQIGKEVHETYSVSNQTSLNIDNKYGNIDIRNWDKKSIDVLVQVKLLNMPEKKAQELLNMISIKYYTQGDAIYFKTEFGDNLNKGLNQFNNGDKKFEVNYIVNMPHSVVLGLKNKYGNVFIDKLSSASVIEIKYGKLKANNISSAKNEQLTNIILGYSEATIETCSWLKTDMKYSKIEIEESKALIFVSKYSKVFVTRGSSVVCESKYDAYEIGTVANFVTNAGYSNFKFKSIGKKIHAETSYSDVRIGFVPASFESISIINRYGSYNIGIEDGASYKLNGLAKYGDIIYPEKSRVNRFQETTDLKVDGLVGTNAATVSEIEIDTKYGTVKLIQ